jgi:hypothetical protein
MAVNVLYTRSVHCHWDFPRPSIDYLLSMGVSVALSIDFSSLPMGVPLAFRVMINYLLPMGDPVALTIDVCRVKKYRKRPERDALRMEMFLNKVQAEKDNALVIMLRNKSSQMVKKWARAALCHKDYAKVL